MNYRYNGHYLCVHCALPDYTIFKKDEPLRIVSTKETRFQILYCRFVNKFLIQIMILFHFNEFHDLTGVPP